MKTLSLWEREREWEGEGEGEGKRERERGREREGEGEREGEREREGGREGGRERWRERKRERDALHCTSIYMYMHVHCIIHILMATNLFVLLVGVLFEGVEDRVGETKVLRCVTNVSRRETWRKLGKGGVDLFEYTVGDTLVSLKLTASDFQERI